MMDVDGGTEGPENNGTIDVEQSLLQQFSCMGTTDKDELVQQLQKLLGSQLNYSTAAFFLDMNNWNLQAAVCSYFDIEYPNKLPSMALLTDPKATECENIEPSASFQKCWRVYNNGSDPWPPGCFLQCADGDSLGGCRQYIPCVQPNTSLLVSVTLTSPSQPGSYQSKWRLCTPSGSYFGDTMWVIITVDEAGTMELTQQLSHLSDLGSSPQNAPASFNPFIEQRSPSTHFQGAGPAEDADSMI